MPAARPFIRFAMAGAALAALSACTSMVQEILPGTPLATAEARYGRPNFGCTRPDGSRRVLWTQQPLGQYAWGTDLTADDRVVRLEEILTDEHFARLREGVWTADRVRCEFGPPATIRDVGLPSVREQVWAYRYRQDRVWNSLMFVYMGRDGDKVTRFHPGPDPMYDDDKFPMW